MRALLLDTILFISIIINVESKTIFAIDEQWVCNIKNSCLECLRQSHCSWCSTENKCFSFRLQSDFCKNDTLLYKDYGLSIEENAACECSADESQQLCRPSGAPDSEPECSGRGSCQCGRCLCPAPDPQQPTKTVMGEFCEFDNFSCDGPDCDEGPYPLVPPEPHEAAAAAPAVEPEVADTEES